MIELVFADDFVPLAPVDVADFFTPNVDLSVADFEIELFSDAPELNYPNFDLDTVVDATIFSTNTSISDEVQDPDLKSTVIFNQAVPEPGAIALFGIGLLGLLTIRRRKFH